MNKYLNLLSDQPILLRLGILAALIVMILGLNSLGAKQSRTIKTLRQEKELVMKVQSMKDKIKGAQAHISRSGLKIEGVVYQNNVAYALINGAIYGEGGSVGDYKIVAIGKNALTILNVSTNEQENFVFQEALEDIQSK